MNDVTKNGGTGASNPASPDRPNPQSSSSFTTPGASASNPGPAQPMGANPSSGGQPSGGASYSGSAPTGASQSGGLQTGGYQSGSSASGSQSRPQTGQSQTGQSQAGQSQAGQSGMGAQSGMSGSSGSSSAGSASSGSQQSGGNPTFADLQEKATQDYQALRDTAKQQASQAFEKSAEMATEKKNVIADQLAGVASALERLGSDMQGEQAMIGRYAKDLGGSAKRLAEDMKGRDMRDIMSMAEDFGRKQPLAFLGLAALAGLAASRFVTASADRIPLPSGPTAGSSASRGTSANPSGSAASSSGQSYGAAGRTTPGQGASTGTGASANRPTAAPTTSLNRPISSTEGRTHV